MNNYHPCLLASNTMLVAKSVKVVMILGLGGNSYGLAVSMIRIHQVRPKCCPRYPSTQGESGSFKEERKISQAGANVLENANPLLCFQVVLDFKKYMCVVRRESVLDVIADLCETASPWVIQDNHVMCSCVYVMWEKECVPLGVLLALVTMPTCHAVFNLIHCNLSVIAFMKNMSLNHTKPESYMYITRNTGHQESWSGALWTSPG